jgi:hypothetical protein
MFVSPGHVSMVGQEAALQTVSAHQQADRRKELAHHFMYVIRLYLMLLLQGLEYRSSHWQSCISWSWYVHQAFFSIQIRIFFVIVESVPSRKVSIVSHHFRIRYDTMLCAPFFQHTLPAGCDWALEQRHMRCTSIR